MFCNLLDKDKSLSTEEKIQKEKSYISDVFKKYCTIKERKEGLPNIISYDIIDEKDKPIEEKVLIVEEGATKYQAILKTEALDSLNSLFQYTFKKKGHKWFIDSKKRFSNWRNKWVIESL